MTLSPLDTLVFAAFIVTVVAVGRSKSRREGDSEFHSLAGRALGGWIIGISLIAANISTEQFVGMIGQAAAADNAPTLAAYVHANPNSRLDRISRPHGHQLCDSARRDDPTGEAETAACAGGLPNQHFHPSRIVARRLGVGCRGRRGDRLAVYCLLVSGSSTESVAAED